MDKFLITAFWILSLLGVGFMSHEFGMIEGSQYQKKVNADQLQNCQRIIVGEMYQDNK